MNSLMRTIFYFFSFYFHSINCHVIPVPVTDYLFRLVRNDTIDIQILYNGRAWRNLYYKIKGDQFLFSPEFLPGSVTIEGKTFSNLQLKYDIYNDELIIITDNGIILQLNKEMIDLFSMIFDNNL